MEEKVYKSNKISLELLEQLKDCEIELGQIPYGYAGHPGYGRYGVGLGDFRGNRYSHLAS